MTEDQQREIMRVRQEFLREFANLPDSTLLEIWETTERLPEVLPLHRDFVLSTWEARYPVQFDQWIENQGKNPEKFFRSY